MNNRKYYLVQLFVTVLLILAGFSVQGQSGSISGKASVQEAPLPFANVFLKGTQTGSATDSLGRFVIKDIPPGKYQVVVSSIGYNTTQKTITLEAGQQAILNFELVSSNTSLDEVVISGTMKEVSKLESPVPVEVYSAKFFKSNPTPSIFESLQNVNGVRPQLNCNVCNTGDIHINGLEGPYTMVLMDGMPIVSGLSTVYGLTGIPQSLIERVEVVKGPASTLYGSEAVGGLINIITKKPSSSPLVSADVFATGWGEVNTDLGLRYNLGEKVQSLLGVNYFNYQNPIDNNHDGFTDVTLQNRISVFNKFSIDREEPQNIYRCRTVYLRRSLGWRHGLEPGIQRR